MDISNEDFAMYPAYLSLALPFVIYVIVLVFQNCKKINTISKSVELNFTSHNEKHFFVSSYYPVTQGTQRHTVEMYHDRARKLFKTFHGQIFIYTNKLGKSILTKNLTVPPNFHFILKYESIYEIHRFKKYEKEYIEVDRIFKKKEKYPFTPYIGAIWNAKLHFLKETIEMIPHINSYFHWLDVGMIKTNELIKRNLTWPNGKRMTKIFKKFNDQKILFSGKKTRYPINRNMENISIKTYNHITASYFGGPRDIILHLVDNYEKIHDYFVMRKQFVIREEYLLSTYSFLFPEHSMFIDMGGSKCWFWHSPSGYIADHNICNFRNVVLDFQTNGSFIKTVNVALKSWD
ncbi:hypothetical protein TRFO_11566 [Tritrichomonas foetus]|uniref:Uncharacterized protein n=1 Tax=Tritrichomonas foetus TaxID=1144522 RepID=A0A1J4J340_9EUKA|nr:hypothetical protein TRFO_11566 [Tritrichomonas foetus]|eukprot:OHS93770.1 hypothetical protein TRFO_11566 [Tritrichomonas foetus]